MSAELERGDGLGLDERVRRRALRARMFGIDEEPIEIGRYRVEHRVGEGAMGVVYAARDARLDRSVAIKVLRPGLSKGSARLEQEARALARVSHPNVVGIHEVGDHEGRTFIAMELVGGRNLRDWMAKPRPLSARLEVLRQAAEGLLAAHRLGIIHRDFKPENAIVGDDGRVRVVDFGLATGVAELRTIGDDEQSPIGLAEAGLERLTLTGARLGTPRYMAPELLAGGSATMASDQYAFCCVAWEVLVGGHPFEDERRGDSPPRPAITDVPTGILEAMRRGLSADPEARHASLEALLLALSSSPLPRRLGRVYASIAVVGVALGAWLLFSEDRSKAPSSTRLPARDCQPPSFGDSRRTLLDNRAMFEAEVARAQEGSGRWADSLQSLAAQQLALGALEPACANLEAASSVAGDRELAACWRDRFCTSAVSLPERARCFGGDLEICKALAIKHEFEYLDSKQEALTAQDPSVQASADLHRAYLVEMLDAACRLGDEPSCRQIESLSAMPR